MIVLDTTVLAALIGRADRTVASWIDRLDEPVVTTAMAAAELRLAVASLPAGRQREDLDAALETMLADDFADGVLPFDELASEAYAVIVAARALRGHPIGVMDAQVAAICATRGARLATRNALDFQHTDIGVINPFE